MSNLTPFLGTPGPPKLEVKPNPGNTSRMLLPAQEACMPLTPGSFCSGWSEATTVLCAAQTCLVL